MYQKKHIGCYGLIIGENKIVLIKKSKGAYTGKLDLPGGTIEHGETPEETVKREIMEEVGCAVSKMELFDATSCNIIWYCEKKKEEENLHHIGIIYKIEICSDNLKTGEDGYDSLGSAWYEIKDLKENQVSPLTWIQLQKLGYK